MNWGEHTAGRGAAEVISALKAAIDHTKPTQKHLIMWFDNCSAQNKSQFHVGFASWLVEQKKFLSITFKYLELGNTFNPCDQAAGVTERAVKKHGTIETPKEMYEILAQSRKSPHPFEVIELKLANFYTWKTWQRPFLCSWARG